MSHSNIELETESSCFSSSFSPDTQGSLSILKSLDREEQALYNLTIIAEDHGVPQHYTSQLLSVQVIDVNDEAPWFEKAEFEAEILENQPPEVTILAVSASDRDQGKPCHLKGISLCSA